MSSIISGTILAAGYLLPGYLAYFSFSQKGEERINTAKMLASCMAGCLLTCCLSILFYILF